MNEEKRNVKLKITWPETWRAPFYLRYPGQSQPQRAYVYLDADGEVTAGYTEEIGDAEPLDVWFKHTIRWEISPQLRGDSLAQELRRLLPLFSRVHAGHTIVWNGTSRVGVLSRDAEEARHDIDNQLYLLTEDRYFIYLANIWEPGDWLKLDSLQDVWPAGMSCHSAAELIRDSAAAEYVQLDESQQTVEEYLDDRLQWALDWALDDSGIHPDDAEYVQRLAAE